MATILQTILSTQMVLGHLTSAGTMLIIKVRHIFYLSFSGFPWFCVTFCWQGDIIPKDQQYLAKSQVLTISLRTSSVKCTTMQKDLLLLFQAPCAPLFIKCQADPAMWSHPPGDDVLWAESLGHQLHQELPARGRYVLQGSGYQPSQWTLTEQ